MLKFLKDRFDLISLGFLALLSPLFVFPREKWLWVLLAGATAIFLGRRILGQIFLPHTPIDPAIATLVLWMLFGVLITHDLAAGSSKIAGLVFGIVFFYVLTGALRSSFRIQIAVVILIMMGLAVSVVGTLSRSDGLSVPQIDTSKLVKSIPKVIIKLERAEAGINPNPLGGTLLLFIPPGLMAFASLLKRDNTNAKRHIRYLAIVGLTIVLGLEIFAIIYSRSFGALAAFGFILLMVGKKRRLPKACLGFAIVIAFFFVMKSPDLNKNTFIKNTRESLSASASGRLPFWQGGLDAVRAHPVFGLGMDHLRADPPFKYGYVHAHNQFIHIAAEMGIPALLAYVAILIGVGWMTIEVTRSIIPVGMILIMRGLAWGQIGFVIFGIADAIPLGSKPGIFFWYSLALMTSIYLYGKDRKMQS